VSSDDLGERMRRHAPTAFHLPGGRGRFMEISDRSDGRVWMSATPVTRETFETFQVEPPWTRTGWGGASMDAAAFRSSPGDPGPVDVETRKLQGMEFLCVARPLGVEPPRAEGGPLRIRVDKQHVVGYRGGRDLRILELDGQHFVEVVGDGGDDAERVLPPGARLDTIHIDEPWIVDLPTPTTAWFWMEPTMRSFQGPVALPRAVTGTLPRASGIGGG